MSASVLMWGDSEQARAVPLPSWVPPWVEVWEAPCGQMFLSLDWMVRRKLLWHTVCGTPSVLILGPQNDRAPAHGNPGMGDGNFYMRSPDRSSARSNGLVDCFSLA